MPFSNMRELNPLKRKQERCDRFFCQDAQRSTRKETLDVTDRYRQRILQPDVLRAVTEQWVADLIKVQTLAKQNKGYRYILVVTDAFFKYA